MAPMDFPDAVQKVIDGFKVTKLSWNDMATYVFLGEGFLRINKNDGTRPQLLVSEGDMTGTDWVVVDD